jgi:lipopolysaccharide/colanic/teichoic acid biosynthesis glycosyltransferase
LTSGRPIIFAQERIGYGGELFTAYKFRTMVSAEEVHHLSEDIDGNSVEGDEKAGKLRIRAVTKTEDKRVTRFGAILRKYRIDELPQAINILKGEMSWIGPRPEALALSQWYQNELPFYSYRHVVRPGITGWAQVNQGHVTDADQVLEKLHYDFFYIKNLSVWLDLLIVLKTVKVVLLGIGAK